MATGRGNNGLRGRKRGLAHPSYGLASAGDLAILPIGGQVEGDEQHQVRRDDTHASEGSKLLSGTLAGARHVGEVSRGEVGVRGEVDESCTG